MKKIKIIILMIFIIIISACKDKSTNTEDFIGNWTFNKNILRINEKEWKLYNENNYLLGIGTYKINKESLELYDENNELQIIINKKEETLILDFYNKLKDKYPNSVVADKDLRITIEKAEEIIIEKYGLKDSSGNHHTYTYEAKVILDNEYYYVFRETELSKNKSLFKRNIFISIYGQDIKEEIEENIYEDNAKVNIK